MISRINWIASAVFVFFFLVVAVMGFLSSGWRRGDLSKLDEWGLGGRRFGVLITWFLLGCGFYTAYTIIAFPAFVFGAGASCAEVVRRFAFRLTTNRAPNPHPST
jgi:solute:Na+ symporter, SSS family